MKCPKCGFNSFEYFDSCMKCSSDLISFKQTYSITPLILPLEAKESLAAEFRSAESSTDQISETIETHDDIFSFDLPEDSSPVPSQGNDDPFNFYEQSSEVKHSSSSKAAEDDIFADLLESTSQAEETPFAAPTAAASSHVSPAAKTSADSSSGPGEFDLESFSWDDTPAASDSTETPDDFDSLFGDAKETAPK